MTATTKLALAAIAATLIGCKGSGIPAVTGKSESEAGALLAKAGLKKGATRYEIADESRVGKVIVQTPAAGTAIAEAVGGAVDLVVGGVAVPRLIDSSAEKAALELQRQGFALGDVKAVPKLAGNGLVTEQSPLVGAAAPRGAPVSITVSTPMLLDVVRGVFLNRLRSTDEFKKLSEADQKKIEQALEQLR